MSRLKTRVREMNRSRSISSVSERDVASVTAMLRDLHRKHMEMLRRSRTEKVSEKEIERFYQELSKSLFMEIGSMFYLPHILLSKIETVELRVHAYFSLSKVKDHRVIFP